MFYNPVKHLNNRIWGLGKALALPTVVYPSTAQTRRCHPCSELHFTAASLFPSISSGCCKARTLHNGSSVVKEPFAPAGSSKSIFALQHLRLCPTRRLREQMCSHLARAVTIRDADPQLLSATLSPSWHALLLPLHFEILFPGRMQYPGCAETSAGSSHQQPRTSPAWPPPRACAGLEKPS